MVRIIGAGVAGATAAHAVRIAAPGIVKRGGIEVLERSGGGAHPGWVTLGPTAMTALENIGLATAVAAAGFAVEEVVSVDRDRRTVFPRREPGHRYPSTHIWRRDLLAVLRAPLDDAGLITYTDHALTSETATEEASTDGGLLIGADGARSAVRSAVLGDTRPLEHAGQSIIYGHTPIPMPETVLPFSVLHFWHAAGRVCGYVADAAAGAFWFCRYDDTPDRQTPAGTWRTYAEQTPFPPLLDVSALFGAFTLWELRPDGPWTGERTVVIGDAAHPLSPASGRGATSAIEDAVILARHLTSASDVNAAIAAFALERQPRALHTHRPGEHRLPPAQTPDDFLLRPAPRTAR